MSANTDSGGYRIISLTPKFGSYQNYPWLAGIAYDSATSTWGLGRVALDRLFADGMDR